MTIIFKNDQWKVEKSGMTGVGDYWIEKARLAERRDDGSYNWPLHVCTKTWVNFELFEPAFSAALLYHHPTYDRAVLAKTYETAHRRIEESIQYDRTADELFPGKWLWTASEMLAVSEERDRRARTNLEETPMT